ncbi:MAG: flagellar basal body P-ring formation chaperone FlgA [Candidatus Gastranaerophilales bacterium]|nr:flagellar basal body P-ring formation chaperone FlgA [Candidatus Gastranaerophilales bacterium]
MKFFVKTLALIVIAGLSISPAFSAVLTKEYIQNTVLEQLSRQYEGEIVIKSMPLVSVTVPDERVIIETTCNFNSPSANKVAKVQIISNGITMRVFFVPIEVKNYKNVLVAVKNIAKDEPLTTFNTAIERRSITGSAASFITDEAEAVNLIAQTPIKAGQPVEKRYLTKKTEVFKDSIVLATFQSGGINLTIETQAMENGGIGDYIKVRSKEYNKIYQGKILEHNRVLIQI